MSIKALDHMVSQNIFTYTTDTWGGDERTEHHQSLRNYSGQVDYKSEIFVVTHHEGGGGGMGAYPDSIDIVRIRK